MSFWPFGNTFSSSSSINKLLEDINPSLSDLLDNVDLLNELNNRQNQKLLDYLVQPTVLNELVDYVVDSVEFFNGVEDNKEEAEIGNDESGDEEHIKEMADAEVDEIAAESSQPQPESQDTHNDDESDERPNGSEDEKESEEPETESEDEIFRRRVHTVAEVLSLDIWQINDSLIDNTNLLNRLWLVLSLDLRETSPTVPFVIKIFETLLDVKSAELLNFLRVKKNLVDIFLNNINIPVIMDLLLRIISTDKPDNPTGIIEVLSDQDMIGKLIGLLSPECPSYVQAASGDFLKALITISANTSLALNVDQNIGPNDLTRKLVSKGSMQQLIDIMLCKGTGLSTIVGIIIEVIRKNNSDYDPFNLLETTIEMNPPNSRDPIYLGYMLELFSENLGKFDGVLMEEAQSQLSTSIGSIEPLGFERFKISELIAELLHCSNMLLLNSPRGEEIVAKRDRLRSNKIERLQMAMGDNILNDSSSTIEATTNGLGDLSLTQEEEQKDDKQQENDEAVEEDEEDPQISPENPFVSEERDESIRANPVIGDLFKIKLVDSNILQHIIHMFLRFPWNNFFHNVIFDLIQQIFNGKLNSYNSFLIVDLFEETKVNLTGIIINGYNDCLRSESESNLRLGYMGHLILIAEEILKFTTLYKPDLISKVIVDRINEDEWDNYVNGVLVKTRELYNTVLGGVSPDDSYIYVNPDAILLGNGAEEDKENEDDEEEGEEDKEDLYEEDNLETGDDKAILEDDLETSSSDSDDDEDFQDAEGAEPIEDLGEELHRVTNHEEEEEI